MFRLAFVTVLALVVTALAFQTNLLDGGTVEARAASAEPSNAYAEVTPETALRGDYVSPRR